MESAAFQPILAIDMVDRRLPTRFEMDFQYLLGYREDIIPVISQKCFQQLPMNAVTFLPGCNMTSAMQCASTLPKDPIIHSREDQKKIRNP